MKRLIYQVNIGKSNLYEHCVKSVAAYCKQHNIDHIVQKTMLLNIKPDPFSSNRSRPAWEKYNGLVIFEKENAFTYFKDYDQIAIIDSDVYIRPGSPNIFDDLDPNVDFAGVVEREMPITEQYAAKIVNYSNMQYSTIKGVDWKWNALGGEFINMGVMVMNKSIAHFLYNQTPKEFISRPRFKPFVDGEGSWKWSTDQTLLNTWIKEEKMKVQHLDWKWNGLYTANAKISECNFVHFFLKDKLPDRGENVQQLMADIQAT